jgi:hypothetical protein
LSSPSSRSTQSSSSSSDDRNGLNSHINRGVSGIYDYSGFQYNYYSNEYNPPDSYATRKNISGYLRVPVNETATFNMSYKNNNYNLQIRRLSDNASILSADVNFGYSTTPTENSTGVISRTHTCSLVANEVYTITLDVVERSSGITFPREHYQIFQFSTPSLIENNQPLIWERDGTNDRHNHIGYFYTMLPIPSFDYKSSNSSKSYSSFSSASFSSKSPSSFSISFSSQSDSKSSSSGSDDDDPNRGINGWRHDSWRTYSYNAQPAPWAYDTNFTYPSFYWGHNPIVNPPYGANDQYGTINGWIMVPTSEALTITNHTMNCQQNITIGSVNLANQMYNANQVTSDTLWLNGGEYYYFEISWIASTTGTPDWLRDVGFRTNSIPWNDFINHALRYFYRTHP